MTSKIINISDDQYYRDFSDEAEAIGDVLSDKNILGIFIDAPKKVDGVLRDRLPILAVEHRTFDQGGKANFAKHATVIGIDHERNIAYANKAIEQEDNYVARAPVSLPGEPLETPEGSYAKYEVFDARTRLGFPWRAGRYSFYVALQDQIFGPLNTEITFPKGTGADQSGRAANAGAMSQLMSPLPGDPLPNYRALKESPSSPSALGIALTVALTNTLRNDTAIPLYGAFCLKPLVSEQLTPDAWRARIEAQSRDDKNVQAWLQTNRDEKLKQLEAAPSSVIPITLVILGSIDGFVTRFTVYAPSYSAVGSDGAVRGHFALDLLRIPGMRKTAQTYYIYALSGEVMEKPVVVVEIEAMPGSASF